MAGDNDKEKTGFSGLSDLASDISGVDDAVSPEPTSETKLSEGTQAQTSTRKETPRSQPNQKPTTSPSPIETVSSGKSSGDSGVKWIFGIIAVMFVIWLIHNSVKSTKKPSYNPPSPSQSYHYPQSSSAPADPTPSTTQSAGLQHEKPPISTNTVLAIPQIRWCVWEGIRIETMRELLDTNEGINKFNRIVNNYNSRCGNYRYHQGSLQRAERDVEAYRSQIVSEAIRDARQLSRSYQPSYPSVSPGASTNIDPKRPNAHHTREAQQLLIDLGCKPGPVDGQYGRRTANAVKAFQRDVGLTQDGWIDEAILSSLKKAKAASKPAVTTPSAPPSQISEPPRTSALSEVYPFGKAKMRSN